MSDTAWFLSPVPDGYESSVPDGDESSVPAGDESSASCDESSVPAGGESSVSRNRHFLQYSRPGQKFLDRSSQPSRAYIVTCAADDFRAGSPALDWRMLADSPSSVLSVVVATLCWI